MAASRIPSTSAYRHFVQVRTQKISHAFYLPINLAFTGIDVEQWSPQLSPNLSSGETIECIKAWYRNCLDCHDQCAQRSKGASWLQLPTRLIDIGSFGSKTCRLRLTNSDSLDFISEGYLTLSHRWGQSKPLQLNSSTAEALEAGILISDLPNCFQDAVFLAHKLGIHYLWIDSICIRQDDEKDWLNEAPRMKNTYNCAAINIVAGHSTGSEDSMFHTQSRRSVQSMTITSDWKSKGPTDYILWNDTAIRNDFQRAPLTQRGWVLQERLLAPRILQFGKSQVYWRCSELFACEGWPQGAYSAEGQAVTYDVDMDTFKSITAGTQTALEQNHQVWLWQWVIVHYSGCQLTYAKDKLIALSGLAQQFRQVTGDRYLAGLWRSSIMELLCWRRVTDNNAAEHRLPYRAPTWSWASVEGQVRFVHFSAQWQDCIWTKDLAEVLDATVTPLHGEDTGQVKDGHMTMKGRLHSFALVAQAEKETVYEVDGQTRTGDGRTFTADVLLDEPEKVKLWILPICVLASSENFMGYFSVTLEGLVLARSIDVDPTRGNDGTYQRVGCFRGKDHFSGMKDKIFGLHIYRAEDDDATDEEASDENGSEAGSDDDEAGEAESDWDDYEGDVVIEGSFRFRRRVGVWHTIKIV